MTVIELLAKQAAEQRELSRDRATEATEAKAATEQAGAAWADARKCREDLERELAAARLAEEEADAEYREALAAMAAHEAEAQQAADIAESLDRIAAQMRDARPEPPHEALAATGLMVEPPKEVPVRTRSCHCGEPDRDFCPTCDGPKCGPCGRWLYGKEPGSLTHQDGSPACGSHPEHGDDPDGSPFDVRPADPGTVARVSAHLPVATPPVPGDPDPGVTMPDLGPARPPLDPPPGEGVHTHAKPGDGLMSRVTGGFPIIRRKRNDEQDGDQQ